MRSPKLIVTSMAVGVAGLLLSAGVFLWTTAPQGGCSSSMHKHHPQDPPRLRAHPPVDGKTPCPMMKAHHTDAELSKIHR